MGKMPYQNERRWGAGLKSGGLIGYCDGHQAAEEDNGKEKVKVSQVLKTAKNIETSCFLINLWFWQVFTEYLPNHSTSSI